MNYKELQNLEDAYYVFLKNLKRKRLIRVEYHTAVGSRGRYDIAFIGYETEKGGLHGIHYIKQLYSYYFGTRGKGGDSWKNVLTGGQLFDLPQIIKDGIQEVIRNKKETKINLKQKKYL
jgi:hypothetical protein